jgi:hypothetical protein
MPELKGVPLVDRKDADIDVGLIPVHLVRLFNLSVNSGIHTCILASRRRRSASTAWESVWGTRRTKLGAS